MGKRKDVVLRLRELDQLRCAVQNMEQALQVLTPEERLVVERLFIHPARGNTQLLCQELCIEQSSVYRRRERALRKLEEVLE